MDYKFYGNKMAKQLLSNINESNCLSHAYLIYGDDGLGKRTFAKLLALTIMCENTVGNKPCFKCKACKKILSDNHPDIKYIGGKTNKNALHIEEIRNLKNDCIIKPNESEYKIYIISNVHNMTVEAFNAFLKTLEEPPKNVIFILTASNIDLLPQTIISRIYPVELFALSDKELKTCLQEEYQDSDIELVYEKIDNIISICKGNMGLAKKFLEDDKFLKIQNDAKQLCILVYEKKEYPILKFVTSYEKNNADFYILLEQFLVYLRECMICKISNLENVKEQVMKLNLSLTKVQIFKLIDFVEKNKIKLQTNANQSLFIATFVAGLKQIIG